jgi:hypothetical protein
VQPSWARRSRLLFAEVIAHRCPLGAAVGELRHVNLRGQPHEAGDREGLHLQNRTDALPGRLQAIQVAHRLIMWGAVTGERLQAGSARTMTTPHHKFSNRVGVQVLRDALMQLLSGIKRRCISTMCPRSWGYLRGS